MWTSHYRDNAFIFKLPNGKKTIRCFRFWRDMECDWIFRVEGSNILKGRYYVT